MATLYANANAAINGSGTASSPFNTLSAVTSAISSGDTVYLSGTFRSAMAMTDVTGTSWLQWPMTGQPGEFSTISQAVITGRVRVSAGDWTLDEGTTYSTPLASPPVTVMWEYASRRLPDRNGALNITNAALAAAASLATCRSTRGTWFHTSGVLYVNHPEAGAAPNTTTDTYEYVRAGNGMVLTRCHNTTIDGIDFDCWPQNSSGQGQPIDWQTATGCSVRNCEFIDFGYHAISFSGTACANNTIEDCRFWGIAANGGSVVVFFSSSSAVSNNVGRRLECHCNPTLQHNLTGGLRTPLVTSMGYTGLLSHGSATFSASGVVYIDCDVHAYHVIDGVALHLGPGVSAWSGTDGGTSPASGDRLNPRAYELVFERCRAFFCARIAINRPTAMLQCYADLTNAVNYTPSTNAIVTYNNSNVCDGLIAGSVIVGDTTAISSAPAVIRAGSASGACRVSLVNSLVADRNTTAGVAGTGLLRRQQATAIFESTQSVYAHAAESANLKLISGNNTGTLGEHIIFDQNWYYNIHPTNATGYSPITTPADLRTKTIWAASVDVNAVYEVLPGFTSPPSNMEGAGGSELRTRRHFMAGGVEGINRLAYDGHYGPYQYGSEVVSNIIEGITRLSWRKEP